MSYAINKNKSWIDNLKIGDVIRTRGTKIERTIIKIYNYTSDTDLIMGVNVPILKCSWTHRGYTGFYRSEMKTKFIPEIYAHIDVYKFPILKKLIEELNIGNCTRVKGAGCCDVVGVIR